MVEKRYSEMTEYELRTEIAVLKEKARKAEQLGVINEYMVMERKIAMAKCYLLNPNDFILGKVYHIEGDPDDTFRIEYMNGIFAWGYRLSNPHKEDALPISMLMKTENAE